MPCRNTTAVSARLHINKNKQVFLCIIAIISMRQSRKSCVSSNCAAVRSSFSCCTASWSSSVRYCFPNRPQSEHLFLIAALPEAIRIRPPTEGTFPLQLQTQPHTSYPVALINHIKMDRSALQHCWRVCECVCVCSVPHVWILYSVHFKIFDRDISLDMCSSRILSLIFTWYLRPRGYKQSQTHWAAATLFEGLSCHEVATRSVDEPDWLTPCGPNL